MINQALLIKMTRCNGSVVPLLGFCEMMNVMALFTIESMWYSTEARNPKILRSILNGDSQILLCLTLTTRRINIFNTLPYMNL